MDNCVIGLETANHQLGIHPKLNKVVRQNVNEELTPIVPLKLLLLYQPLQPIATEV